MIAGQYHQFRDIPFCHLIFQPASHVGDLALADLLSFLLFFGGGQAEVTKVGAEHHPQYVTEEQTREIDRLAHAGQERVLAKKSGH